MQGYLYLDNDGNLNIRNKDYIEIEDPGFWGRNSHLIDIVWKFDTEDSICMESIMYSLKKKDLKSRQVVDMCKAIGFDLEKFVLNKQRNKDVL